MIAHPIRAFLASIRTRELTSRSHEIRRSIFSFCPLTLAQKGMELDDDDVKRLFYNFHRAESADRPAQAKVIESAFVPLLQSPPDAHTPTLDTLRKHLPILLRLSVQCPDRPMRAAFSKILADLQAAGHAVPQQVFPHPSHFIPAANVCVFMYTILSAY